jgi:hydrogenase maturation factor
MEQFHIADYFTLAGFLTLLGVFSAQIQGLKQDLKVDIAEVKEDIKELRSDVNKLIVAKAEKDGEEKGYARAKAEIASANK